MRKYSLLVMILLVLQLSLIVDLSAQPNLKGTQCRPASASFFNEDDICLSADPVFHDGFDSDFGFNSSLWDLETYGGGSVGWVAGEYFNMSCERHAYRTLSSKSIFEVGQEVSVRMKMEEAEAIVLVGWTNQTPTTGWNYRFAENSVNFQGALSIPLLEVSPPDSPSTRTILSGVDISEWHTYRLVWNNSFVIAYVDGERLGVIRNEVPSGPLHFKMAITEFRNMTTEGWVLIDSVSISPHQSMLSENPPFIVLQSPGNGTLNLPGDSVEVAVVGSDDTLFFSWDGAQNQTIAPPFGLVLPSSSGIHTLDLYCRDGYGMDNWESAHYVFEVVDQPPKVSARFLINAPLIDGIISQSEWPEVSRMTLKMYRTDGLILDVDILLGHDDTFLFVGIDSPIPSGHDSTAALVLNGIHDGAYHGGLASPIRSLLYGKASPTAWDGYSELQFLNETEDGTVRRTAVSQIPNGFASEAIVVESGVNYEFRIPLSELDLGARNTIGLSIMLHPSGMRVTSFYYPMVSWEDAVRLATAELLPRGAPIEFYVGSALGISAIAGVSYVLVRRRTPRDLTGVTDSSEMRLIELVGSYDQIGIGRLSRLAGLSESETEAGIKALIRRGELVAEYDAENHTVRRK